MSMAFQGHLEQFSLKKKFKNLTNLSGNLEDNKCSSAIVNLKIYIGFLGKAIHLYGNVMQKGLAHYCLSNNINSLSKLIVRLQKITSKDTVIPRNISSQQ